MDDIAPADGRLRLSRIYHGWWIVAVAVAVYAFVFSTAVGALPMVYGPIIAEYGWSHAEVTAIASLKALIGSAMYLIGGVVVQRVGARLTASLATIGFALAMTAFLWVHALWQLYAVSLVLGACSSLTVVVILVSVSKWFNRRLGLAIAIASLGSSVGGSIVPFVASHLIPHLGWRMTLAAMGPLALLIALPMVILLLKESPADVGLAEGDVGPAPPVATDPQAAPLGATAAQIVRTPTFWFFAMASCLTAFVDNGLNQHLVLYLQGDAGLPLAVAAAALSMTFAVGFFGKFVFGTIFDRFSVYGIGFCYALLGVSVVLISPIFLGLVPVLLANAVRGLSHGGVVVDVPVAAKHCYGPVPLAWVIGVWGATGSLGGAAGPFVIGVLYDRSGNYGSAFVVMAVACFSSALFTVLCVPAYRRLVAGRAVILSLR